MVTINVGRSSSAVIDQCAISVQYLYTFYKYFMQQMQRSPFIAQILLNLSLDRMRAIIITGQLQPLASLD
jgi:hypothetical protein